jgi:hypothetical protein
MAFSCSVCSEKFRSKGGLTRHTNSKHNKSSTLAGMAEVSQSHTFIRHPFLSGKFKPNFDLLYKLLNIYEPGHVRQMAHSSKIPSRLRLHLCQCQTF